jgi:phage-related tail fiber protein
MKLTTTGAAKVAAAQLPGGNPVELTHIAVGDGNGNPVALPTGTETALVREVYRDQIADLATSTTDNQVVVAEMTIPTAAGGWTVREVGIFDADGDLFAYGNFPATFKPTGTDGATREMVIRAALRVSSTDAVVLVIDDTIVLASRAWTLSQISAAKIIPGGLTGQLLAKSGNADGEVHWIDISEGIQVLVDVVQEVQTLATAQDVVTFSTVTTNGLAVYIEGARLILGTDYTIDSDTEITLATTYPDGTVLHAYQNDPLEAPEYLRPSLNLGDVANTQLARANIGAVGEIELFFMGQN